MPAMSIELKGVRATLSRTNKIMKNHRVNVQKALAIAMASARIRAEDRILPNKYGPSSWHSQTLKQHVVEGRLTNRTGKLSYMLSHKLTSSKDLRNWKTWGNRVLRKSSVAFKEQIKATRYGAGNKTKEDYSGTLRVYINGSHGTLMSRHRGKPKETKKTLALRFRWETGIKGVKRPIFKPVVKAAHFEITKYLKIKDKLLRGGDL